MQGERLGPYRLDAELGSGGMGTVWRATGADGGVVAIKVVHPHLLGALGFRERFEREAKVGLAIRHANVVTTLACIDATSGGKRVPALVLEYVEGRSLTELLAELRRVPEDLCRHLAREIARGLEAIHAAGIVHRDLKPGNVLITPRHEVKVMDLGLARSLSGDDRLSSTGVFVGTASYAPPEQFRGTAELDPRSDLWSLGAMLYELATGELPFRAESLGDLVRQVLSEQPRRPGSIAPQISPFFEEMILRLLAKSPADRFASAAELGAVLDLGERSPWWAETDAQATRIAKRPPRRVRIPRETAMWGREKELADLRARWERAKAGDGQVLVLEGEPGIGKSRLVDEFLAGLGAATAHVLVGGWPPGGFAGASGAFTNAFGEHFAKDEDALRRALSDTPLLVPAFAALLRGDAPPPGAEPLSRESLATVLVHATRSLASEKPLVVVLDDLHFAPEEGRALFSALAWAVPGHRVLLLATARPTLPAAWYADLERGEHFAKRALARLDTPAIETQIAKLLGGSASASRLASRIAAKSGGNPFFVFEMLRALRESGVVSRDSGGAWSVVRDAGDVVVPESLRDLVAGRLASLDADDREILEAASCQGAEFDGRLVAEALGRPRFDVLRRLGRIEREAGLVRAAGPRFAFDHHLVHEVLRESIAPALREEYHAATAEAIERQHDAAAKEPKDLSGHVCADLAEHWMNGARGDRAVRYVVRAIAHLGFASRPRAAVALADRFLAVAGLLSGALRAEVLAERFGQLVAFDPGGTAETELAEALRLADEFGSPSLRVQVRVAHLWNVQDFKGQAAGWDDAAWRRRAAVAAERMQEAVELATAATTRPDAATCCFMRSNLLQRLGRETEANVCRVRGEGLRSGPSHGTVVTGDPGVSQSAYTGPAYQLILSGTSAGASPDRRDLFGEAIEAPAAGSFPTDRPGAAPDAAEPGHPCDAQLGCVGTDSFDLSIGHGPAPPEPER